MKTIDEVPILLRREIEASFLKPFLDAFSEEIGRERALEIVGEVIDRIAFESGKRYAEQAGGAQLADAAESLMMHNAEGDCDNRLGEPGGDYVRVDTYDCEYVRMYERLGMRELGYLLSCRRDYKFFEGMNSRMRLVRENTRMQGADKCDFKIEMKEEG